MPLIKLIFISYFIISCISSSKSGGSKSNEDPNDQEESSKPNVMLILTMGNSHTIGRDSAIGTDVFPSNVWQWTQSGELKQPTGATLDFGDDSGNFDELDYCSDHSLATEIAENHNFERIVFVPRGKGSTGFSTGDWSSANVSSNNLLFDAVDRYKKAKEKLIEDGYNITEEAVFFHNANPDYNSTTTSVHRENIDSMISYIRTNIGSTIPIIIGGGMNDGQLSGRAVNDNNFQANLLGAYRRNKYVASYDTINSRFGYSTGLPIQIFDSIHADRSGDITKGKLRYRAWLRAKENVKPTDPFESLSTWGNIYAAWDFRTGGPKDMSGNGNDLTQPGSNPVLHRVASDVDELVFDRPAGTDRVYQSPVGIPLDYTISIIVRPSVLDTTMGLVNKSNGSSSGQIRLYFSASGTGQLVAGHSSQEITVDQVANFSADAWSVVHLSYESGSGDLNLYVDGSLVGSASSVSAHSPTDTTGFFIGSQNDVYSGLFTGDILGVFIYNKALTSTEISDWNTAAQTILP